MDQARTFAFGPFLLVPERQQLMRDDTPVRIGGRALDLLTALVECPGQTVSKAQLMARAWPTAVVVETNLKVNVASLRRALGDVGERKQYIATINGRGYRFIAPVSRGSGPAPWAAGVGPLASRPDHFHFLCRRCRALARHVAAAPSGDPDDAASVRPTSSAAPPPAPCRSSP